MIDAARAVVLAYDAYSKAQTPIQAAYCLMHLSDTMSDLKTWIPGYNYETGEIEDGSE